MTAMLSQNDYSWEEIPIKIPQNILQMPTGRMWGGSSCPVCNENARDKVVAQIIVSLRLSGSFSVRTASEFWERYGEDLCPSCRADIASIAETKQKALDLLEESLRIDNNSTTRQNLDAVKRML